MPARAGASRAASKVRTKSDYAVPARFAGNQPQQERRNGKSKSGDQKGRPEEARPEEESSSARRGARSLIRSGEVKLAAACRQAAALKGETMPLRPTPILRRAHRAAPPKEACACKRSLIDVEARKTGLKDPGAKWVRLCRCGSHHYCGDMVAP